MKTRILKIILPIISICWIMNSHAVNVAKKPLFLESAMPPNIMFTIDDSGSMARNYLPESIGNDSGNCSSNNSINVQDYYGLSSANNHLSLCNASNYNSLFYNPSITYTPRINADGTSQGNNTSTTPTCSSPVILKTTCTVTQAYTPAVNGGTFYGTRITTDTQKTKNYSQCNGSTADGRRRCVVTCTSPNTISNTINGSCPVPLPTYSYTCNEIPSGYASYATSNLVSGDSSCHKDGYFYYYCQKDDGTIFATTDQTCRYTKTSTPAIDGSKSCVVSKYYQNPNNAGAVPFQVGNPYSTTTASTTPGLVTTSTSLDLDNAAGCKYIKYTPSDAATKQKQDTDLSKYSFVDINSQESKTYDSRVYNYNTKTLTSLRTDCLTNGNTACTFTEEETNYKNWYKYYRTRMLAAQTYIGLAFKGIKNTNRVGFARINKLTSTNIDGSSTDTIVLPVKKFNSTNRSSFYSTLYGVNASGGTPLRRAMDSVGVYFSRGATGGSPWADNPSNLANPGSFSQCRQAYNILMTDGYWTEDSYLWDSAWVDPQAATASARANVDATDGAAITRPGNTNYIYKAAAPYTDDWSNTLADVAMYYWKRDLVPGDILANKVPTTASDPVAVWQHLTQYTVGFGVEGKLNADNPTLTNSEILQGITDGTIVWPNPSSDDAAKLDDLWHAAVNSRGGFFNASNPTEFVNALNATLKEIESYTGSYSIVSANTTSLSANSAIYQGGFLSGWIGRLYKYSLNETTGVVSDTPVRATTPAANNRNIYTWGNDGTATSFQWTNLSDEQKARLNTNPDSGLTDGNGEDRLNYLRGIQSSEQQNGGSFRNRKLPAGTQGSAILGDIINSSPSYVSNEDYGYGDKTSKLTTVEKTSYAAFNKSTRDPMVYVGANDGMLHAFDAESLEEKFAVIPSVAFTNLNLLTSTDYAHEYYVDGTPIIGDAYFNSSWKTILLGSTGNGGKSIFAIDITDPSQMNASKLMWQFDTSNGTYANDMGYSIPHPSIVRLHNGKFAAIVSNGYSSVSGHAVLFIIDIQNGSVIRKIDTNVGSDNGLSSPAPVDVNNDKITDFVYAGDLKGNIWKFDLTSTDPDSWTFSKLFTACTADTCSDSNRQPITTKPEIIRNPKGGYNVLFGTGSYFSTTDNTASRIETIYGVRDTGTTALTRTSLLRQKIVAETNSYRVISDTQVNYASYNGWYLPLVYPDNSTTASGERVINDVVLSNQKLIVTTTIPSAASSCDSGGQSWLMELDPINGSRLSYVVLDTNGDGTINDADRVDYRYGGSDFTGIASSGKKYSGLITAPTIIQTSGGSGSSDEINYITNSSGQVVKEISNNSPTQYGRQSWRQIK